MKITLNIDDELISQGMIILNTVTIEETIEKALTEVVNRNKREFLIESKGKVNLDIDIDTLRDRRSINILK